MWIDEGLIGSICRHCKNWIFYDWYLCNEFMNCEKDGSIILPVTKCIKFKEG